MNIEVSNDDDVNMLFDEIAFVLVNDLEYSQESASGLCEKYYECFTDEKYCDGIGIPVQDDDFFFHEGANGMALRIYYYLGIKGNPNPHNFIDWRASRRKQQN